MSEQTQCPHCGAITLKVNAIGPIGNANAGCALPMYGYYQPLSCIVPNVPNVMLLNPCGNAAQPVLIMTQQW